MAAKSIVERVRTHTAKHEYEAALEILIDAWRDTRAPAIADAIDAIDAFAEDPAEPPKTEAWLADAKRAKTHVARGALLRTACKRTSDDISTALAAVSSWDDPRLTKSIVDLLVALPFSGKRTRDTWRDVFIAVKTLADPRFLAVETTLPAKWNVGAETKRFLANRFADATKGLEVPALPSPVATELAAFTAELGKAKPAPAANEVALLDAIYANPTDDAPRLVYADWLQERGDPRGDFIAMQLASTRDLAAERALVKKHKKAWLGPLATVLGGDLEFRRGFPAVGAAKFRHQHDAEQFGSLREWATVEELEFSPGTTRDDQERWTRFVHPSMTGLRSVKHPHLDHVFGVSRPWSIEELVVGWRNPLADGAALRRLCESPLLPKLRHLTVHGTIAPEWLEGVTACPSHLTVFGKIGNAAKFLENARRIAKLETFEILDGYRFTRDAKGAFTRLDVVIENERYKKVGDVPPWLMKEIVAAIKKMPAGSLTHVDGGVDLRGTFVRLPEIAKAGTKVIGA